MHVGLVIFLKQQKEMQGHVRALLDCYKQMQAYCKPYFELAKPDEI